MALAENLKTARGISGMTLEDVAERLGVDFTAVHKWENGIRVPSGIYLVELADIFNTTAETLVKGEIKKENVK